MWNIFLLRWVCFWDYSLTFLVLCIWTYSEGNSESFYFSLSSSLYKTTPSFSCFQVSAVFDVIMCCCDFVKWYIYHWLAAMIGLFFKVTFGHPCSQALSGTNLSCNFPPSFSRSLPYCQSWSQNKWLQFV